MKYFQLSHDTEDFFWKPKGNHPATRFNLPKRGNSAFLQCKDLFHLNYAGKHYSVSLPVQHVQFITAAVSAVLSQAPMLLKEDPL